jgi:hypothetical protein
MDEVTFFQGTPVNSDTMFWLASYGTFSQEGKVIVQGQQLSREFTDTGSDFFQVHGDSP